MSKVTEDIFGRGKLPKIAILYAGGYFEDRSKQFLSIFDEADEIKGGWVPYTFAKYQNNEYFIVFNIYGAAITLEVLSLLKEGGVEIVIFNGLMFSTSLPIGHQVLVSEVYDRSGVVLLDTDGKDNVKQKTERISLQKSIYEELEVPVEINSVVSVPCVMHGINPINEFIRSAEVQGVEMELSTFYHFSQKLGLDNYAFLVVSDNPQHSLMDHSKTLSELRVNGRNLAGKIALHLISKL